MNDEKPMGQVIQIDEARIRDHLGEMVRGTVEETLNAMLDAEADQLCGAGRYEGREDRAVWRTRCAGLAATSAVRPGRIHGPAATNGRCRPAPGRSISRFRSCGARR